MDLASLPAVVEARALEGYAAFLRDAAARPFDPYYSEETRRFELRPKDVLVVPPDLVVSSEDCGALLVSERAQARLVACGVTAEDAARVLAALDGTRTAEEARLLSGVTEDTWERLVPAAFGSVLFAPLAVARLEERVSGAEIVRFAGSPYEIVRSYWENMASVAERLEAGVPPSLESGDGLLRLLRELHALALVGPDGRSFYRPASPIAGKQAGGPGELLLAPSIVEAGTSGARFVSGPRVGAGTIGGERYHELLVESLGELSLEAPGRDAPWGRVVVCRSDADEEEAPWFCPPRPLSSAHFEALRALLASGLSRDAARALPALARFHWSFVRLHPFVFANQCIAMSLVNHALRDLLGAGIPHHVLDHLALRLPAAAYERVFETAVSAWLVRDESPVRRTLALVSRKRRAFDLLNHLSAAATRDAARRIVRERPDDARLVLIGVGER